MNLGDDAITEMKNLLLPHELIAEILSWIPIERLSPLRFVCKPWFHLLTLDAQFAKLHFDRSIQLQRNPSVLAVRGIDYRGKSDFYLATDHTACNKAIKLKSPSHEHNNYAADYTVSGICNGLLCLFIHGGSETYIWNPLTGDHITIPFSPKSQRFNDPTSFAFGFHPATNEYKVIKVLESADDSSYEYHSQVCVYTLGVDSSWRTVGEDIPYQMTHLGKPGPVINSALHWVARSEVLVPFTKIVAFDLTDESFQVIGFPNEATYDSYIFVEFVELDGLLSLFFKLPDVIQIWTMKEYGVVTSWTQQFNIGSSELGGVFIDMMPLATVAHNGEFIFKDGSTKLVLYNPKTNSIKKLNNFRFEFYDAYSYIGSILSPRVINGAACITT